RPGAIARASVIYADPRLRLGSGSEASMRRSLDETNVMARRAKPARQTVPSWDRRFALLYRAALSLPFPYPRRCRIALLAENGSANVAAVLHRDGGEGKRGMTARVAPRVRGWRSRARRRSRDNDRRRSRGARLQARATGSGVAATAAWRPRRCAGRARRGRHARTRRSSSGAPAE